MKFISLITLFFQLVNGDLRMASLPKENFKVQNSLNSIPFVKNSIAIYMEPSDFNYQGLKNQRANNYDNFLRSNIDNEQDNRNFNSEIGRDMLPFRTLEGNIKNNFINAEIGQKIIIPLRWNNPHSSECEINIWLKSQNNNDIVVPIKKPSCCGEGYQDAVIDFTIPNDFEQLKNKVPGFTGCNKIGDCTLQIYGHSVEPRTYAIGVPILINSNNLTSQISENNKIEPATVDPQLNLNILPRDICLPTTDTSSNVISSVPRFARLVSDQFNHAYQNSDFSPYSGQQHESISRNLQAATILRMTAANGGELGKSILSEEDNKFIQNLIAKVNKVVQKYEQTANNIFNSIKNDYSTSSVIGNQQLANCFRCSDTGSVSDIRLETQTYIPSFEIKNKNTALQIKNNLPSNVKKLIPQNSSNVLIYQASLSEVMNDFKLAYSRGFTYQPAMIKNTITTMYDKTNFLKINENGENDEGVYAATLASITKKENIQKISSFYNTPTTDIYSTTIEPTTELPTVSNVSNEPTLPLNPDDISGMYNFCGKTYNTIDCNSPCYYGTDSSCLVGICFNTAPEKCKNNSTVSDKYFCGKNINTIDCNKPCSSQLNSECSKDNTLICFEAYNYCKIPKNNFVNNASIIKIDKIILITILGILLIL